MCASEGRNTTRQNMASNFGQRACHRRSYGCYRRQEQKASLQARAATFVRVRTLSRLFAGWRGYCLEVASLSHLTASQAHLHAFLCAWRGVAVGDHPRSAAVTLMHRYYLCRPALKVRGSPTLAPPLLTVLAIWLLQLSCLIIHIYS